LVRGPHLGRNSAGEKGKARLAKNCTGTVEAQANGDLHAWSGAIQGRRNPARTQRREYLIDGIQSGCRRVCGISSQRLALHAQVQIRDRNESYQQGEQVDHGVRQASPIMVFLMEARVPLMILPLEDDVARRASSAVHAFFVMVRNGTDRSLSHDRIGMQDVSATTHTVALSPTSSGRTFHVRNGS
jgi:hypothetical protein